VNRPVLFLACCLSVSVVGTAATDPESTTSGAARQVASQITLSTHSVEVGTSFQAYVGGGTNISPPDTIGDSGGIPLISISRGASFLAGEVRSNDAKTRLVKITVRFDNPARSAKSFKIGDLALIVGSHKWNDFLAVGYGSKVCAISSTDRKTVQQIVVDIPPGESRILSYVFPVDASDPRHGQLTLANSRQTPVDIDQTTINKHENATTTGGKPDPGIAMGGSGAVVATVPGRSPLRSGLTGLRFDGVYKTTQNALAGANYWGYLRFYPDGEVIECSSTSLPQDLHKWFSREHGGLSHGIVAMQEKRVSFSAVDEQGTVDFTGLIDGDQLRLEFHSLVNDHRGTDVYQFVKWPEELSAEH